MRIVVLTDGSSHGAEILRALQAGGITADTIFRQQPYQAPWSKVRKSLRRFGLRQTASDIVRVARSRMQASPVPYQSFARRVFSVTDFNAGECLELLRQQPADIMILAGAPILKSDTLATARVVLNAHPGLLPKYRGLDVIAWAVRAGDPVGVTIHQVDAGIDTGAILLQEVVRVAAGDSLNSLCRKAEILCGELMARVVSQVLAGTPPQPIPQTQASGQSYRRMPLNLRRDVEGMLRNAPLFS